VLQPPIRRQSAQAAASAPAIPAKAVLAATARPAAANSSLGLRQSKMAASAVGSCKSVNTNQVMSSADNELSKLLENWDPNAELDVNFNRQVWIRLEGRVGSSWEVDALLALLERWLRVLARPRLAFAATTIAIFIGILVGGLQARSMQKEQYLLSVNPYWVNSTQTNLR